MQSQPVSCERPASEPHERHPLQHALPAARPRVDKRARIFAGSVQVLLSCSHTFHQRCLRSFEHFARGRRCPICRSEGYQTRLINDGRSAYTRRCATLIQAHWRGHAARQRYRAWRVQHRPAHPALWRSWLEDRVAAQARDLREQAEAGGEDLVALFAECDEALAECRPVFARADAALGWRFPASADPASAAAGPKVSHGESISSAGSRAGSTDVDDVRAGDDVDWPCVLDKFRRRDHNECPICMAALSRGGGRATSLLSCSHAFHSRCIAAFAAFEQADDRAVQPSCPVCRAAYTRCNLQPCPTTTWKLAAGNARAAASRGTPVPDGEAAGQRTARRKRQ